MNLTMHKGALALAAGVLLSAGVAFAQTANSVSFSLPAPTSATPGASQATLATFKANAPSGTVLYSLPLQLAASNAAPTDLTNCAAYGPSGTALGAGVNPQSTASATNFTFSPPYVFGSGEQTWTVRCDVARATPADAQFQFTFGIPNTGTTTTPAVPNTGTSGTPGIPNTGAVAPFTVAVATPVSVPAGSAAAALGVVVLNASGSGNGVVSTALPVTVTANGNAIGDLTGCSLRDVSNLAGAIPSVASVNGNQLVFTLGAPLTTGAGGTVRIAVICGVSALTPVGSSFTVAVDPAAVTSASGGASITPTTGVGANGGTLPTSGTVLVTGVGTAAPGIPNTGAPGIPNTGSGGQMPLMAALLVLSGFLAVGGALYFGQTSRA